MVDKPKVDQKYAQADEGDKKRHVSEQFDRRWQAYRLELTRATTAFEHAAIRPLFLLNGGALIVVMAFLGAIWDDAKQPDLIMLYWSLGFWFVGLVLAAVVTIFGYRSQFAFLKATKKAIDAVDSAANEEPDEVMYESIREVKTQGELGEKLRTWAESLGVTSLVFFAVGVLLTFRAFTSAG